MTSEIKRRFTDTEMQTARATDLPELLTHLGYQVKRIGRYHTTAEMDSLRIKDRRTWFRYSQGIGGDAITFLQHFCNQSFPEAVEYLLTFQGRPRDAPVKTKPVTKQDKPSEQFALPPRNADDHRVFAYLRKRGIAAQVIRQFMNSGSLYEDAVHHNCVFVGNELFTFRVWLVRLGLNGEEFKHTRDHLLANLDGDRAWRFDKDSYAVNKKKKKSREMAR